jgi:outer membrane lipoprotein-sorting protein
MRKLHFALFVALLTVSVSVHADWQGTLSIHTPEKEGLSTGKIFAKGARIRFEMEAQGHNLIILADMKNGQSSMLMPEQKLVMDVPKGMAEKQMMTCSTEDVDACFKKKGFKQVGNETIDGHPCAILEGVEKSNGKEIHQKIWRPIDLKEVFMLRSVTRMTDGKEITTDVRNVQVAKVAEALFLVPKDYQKMQLPDFSKMRGVQKNE